jgi:hypothetical protein
MMAPPSLPRPIVRGVPEDSPPSLRAPPEAPPRRPVLAEVSPAPLTLPPPEQLGIGIPRPVPAGNLDWNVVHGRLRQLGSLTFQLQKGPEGGYRFLCLLPTRQPDRARRIEASAATEAEAVQSVLAQAEQWAAAGR